MARMIDLDVVREQIPEECNLTLAHAKMHLDNSIKERGSGDREQSFHEAYMAALILLVMVVDFDNERAG